MSEMIEYCRICLKVQEYVRQEYDRCVFEQDNPEKDIRDYYLGALFVARKVQAILDEGYETELNKIAQTAIRTGNQKDLHKYLEMRREV